MVQKISFKKRTIDFGGISFQDVSKPDIVEVEGSGTMLLPKMAITKEVAFFWDRTTKKLTAKCNPIQFDFQKNTDEFVRNFKVMTDKPSHIISNEEIVHMRGLIQD